MTIEFDPEFCNFCQDALPTGTMLIVYAFSQKTISRTNFRVCSRCGRGYTDAVVGKKAETGEVAVFQFEHDLFNQQIVKDAIAPLAEQIDNLVCRKCGDRINRYSSDEKTISAQDFATKMLRLNPGADSVQATCAKCASLDLCRDCDGDHED